jgi:hypothetical protein
MTFSRYSLTCRLDSRSAKEILLPWFLYIHLPIPFVYVLRRLLMLPAYYPTASRRSYRRADLRAENKSDKSGNLDAGVILSEKRRISRETRRMRDLRFAQGDIREAMSDQTPRSTL